MRMIDADALEPYYRLMQDNETGMKMMALPDGVVDQQPTVDAVPVIRCKDCIRWRHSKSDTSAMVCDWDRYEKTEKDYCSWAKRREDDTD